MENILYLGQPSGIKLLAKRDRGTSSNARFCAHWSQLPRKMQCHLPSNWKATCHICLNIQSDETWRAILRQWQHDLSWNDTHCFIRGWQNWIKYIHPRFTKGLETFHCQHLTHMTTCPLPFQNFESNMISIHEWHCFSPSRQEMSNWVCFYCSLWIQYSIQFRIPERPWKPVPLTELAAKMAKPVEPGSRKFRWMVAAMFWGLMLGKRRMVRW